MFYTEAAQSGPLDSEQLLGPKEFGRRHGIEKKGVVKESRSNVPNKENSLKEAGIMNRVYSSVLSLHLGYHQAVLSNNAEIKSQNLRILM